MIVNGAVSFDLSEVADTTEQAVGDAGSAAGAASEQLGGGLVDLDIKNSGTAGDDLSNVGFVVEIEMMGDAETVASRR